MLLLQSHLIFDIALFLGLFDWIQARGLSSFPLKRSEPACSDPFCQAPDWLPSSTLSVIGQLSGVDVSADNRQVFVFHRGDRAWDGSAFDGNNVYVGKDYPIPGDTILALDATTGAVQASLGSDLFYLPHMLTADTEGNFWVTDVGLHQVLKLRPDGSIVFTLGTKLEPGSDDAHFCKPTSVAVMSSGSEFFVADGYCNARVIKYSIKKDPVTGKEVPTKMFQFGQEGSVSEVDAFSIPHSLTLINDESEVCVADREHGRVQCFDVTSGDFTRSMAPDVGSDVARTVYGVDYSEATPDLLYAVTGPDWSNYGTPEGYAFNLATASGGGSGSSQFRFLSEDFSRPHDVAVSPDGNSIYVIELNQPYNVWKFHKNA